MFLNNPGNYQRDQEQTDLASGNLGSINQLVDKKVMPILDFEKMTSLAVGKEWRSATESQKSSLMKVFRQHTFNLLGFYKVCRAGKKYKFCRLGENG